MNQKKKILFLTGTRADFGKMKPLMEEVDKAEDFEAYVFATGMHMLSLYGSTVKEIAKSNLRNIYSYINQDSSIISQMDMVLANTIQGLGHYVREFPPDMIVLHGDRVETLAGAIVGALNNILVAHIEGGEVSGTVDELIRHAVSKISHVHFVSNEQARTRLIQMGEDPHVVVVIGSPDIDVMLSDKLPSLEDVKAHYEIAFQEYAILIFHPVTTELDSLKAQAEAITRALEASSMSCVIIYPNNDIGADIILEAYRQVSDKKRFRLIPSMRFEHFLTLLKHAAAIIGNSSAGVREAPVYGVPTLNIGTRQNNRFHYQSILDLPADRERILTALQSLPHRMPPSLHFGRGDSTQLFMRHLRNQALWNISLQKTFFDITIPTP